MSEIDLSFVPAMLQRIQSSITDQTERFDKRMASIEQRMGNLERRQTAAHHFEQSVLAHLSAMHEQGDNATADLHAAKRIIDELEIDMRSVKQRLESLEAH